MDLTHMNREGRARMVDVSEKAATVRVAVARGRVAMAAEPLAVILKGTAKKGDVLAVAQVAGIMAAKKTADIIPMCHPIALSGCDISFKPLPESSTLEITATVKTTGPPGVEKEALTAVAAAALTIYDMVKAMDRGMIIEDICLMEKSGGKSGIYRREI